MVLTPAQQQLLIRCRNQFIRYAHNPAEYLRVVNFDEVEAAIPLFLGLAEEAELYEHCQQLVTDLRLVLSFRPRPSNPSTLFTP